jgi:hypothetical protein
MQRSKIIKANSYRTIGSRRCRKIASLPQRSHSGKRVLTEFEKYQERFLRVINAGCHTEGDSLSVVARARSTKIAVSGRTTRKENADGVEAEAPL